MNNIEKLLQVGRFLITPMTRRRDDGNFDAVVSIRSGKGMASVDRVLRFTPTFPTSQAALHYATAEGRHWALAH